MDPKITNRELQHRDRSPTIVQDILLEEVQQIEQLQESDPDAEVTSPKESVGVTLFSSPSDNAVLFYELVDRMTDTEHSFAVNRRNDASNI